MIFYDLAVILYTSPICPKRQFNHTSDSRRPVRITDKTPVHGDVHYPENYLHITNGVGLTTRPLWQGTINMKLRRNVNLPSRWRSLYCLIIESFGNVGVLHTFEFLVSHKKRSQGRKSSASICSIHLYLAVFGHSRRSYNQHLPLLISYPVLPSLKNATRKFEYEHVLTNLLLCRQHAAWAPPYVRRYHRVSQDQR